KRLPSFSTDLYASGLLAPISFEVEPGTFGTYSGIGPIPNKKTKITTEPTFNLFAAASLKQPISQLYRINMGIKASQLSVELDREDLRARRIGVANKVRATYYEIPRLQSAACASGAAIKAYKELVLFSLPEPIRLAGTALSSVIGAYLRFAQKAGVFRSNRRPGERRRLCSAAAQREGSAVRLL